MAEEIAFENGRTSNFEGLVTLTLTLDRVILHIIVHHSSISTYMPNFMVRLSPCSHISKTSCPTFTKCFKYIVTCGRGSVLLWKYCNTICTSGFADDVMFSHNGANGSKSSTLRLIKFARWRHRKRRLSSPTASCFIMRWCTGSHYHNSMKCVTFHAAVASTVQKQRVPKF